MKIKDQLISLEICFINPKNRIKGLSENKANGKGITICLIFWKGELKVIFVDFG